MISARLAMFPDFPVHLHPPLTKYLPTPPHGDRPGHIPHDPSHGQVYPLHVHSPLNLHLLVRHHPQRQLPVDEQAEDAARHQADIPRDTAAPALYAPPEHQQRGRSGYRRQLRLVSAGNLYLSHDLCHVTGSHVYFFII